MKQLDMVKKKKKENNNQEIKLKQDIENIEKIYN